jgi:HEPN domain-containing protein
LPRKTDSSNPADWLLIVESDMEALRAMIGQELGYNLCRSKLAEALEKTIKAELIRTGWFLEKTHDLARLHDIMVVRGCDLAALASPVCAELAQAYFSDRYPGFDLDHPNWPKLREQLRQIEALLATVKARVAPASPAQ